MRLWRLLVTVLLSAVWIISIPVAAYAHTNLESITPADGASVASFPSEVTATFTKPVTVVGKGLSVRGQRGVVPGILSSAEEGTRWILSFNQDPQPSAGEYTYTWKFAAADGHVISGTATFRVERSDRTISAGTPIDDLEPTPDDESHVTIYVSELETPTGHSTAAWVGTRIGLALCMVGTILLGAALIALAWGRRQIEGSNIHLLRLSSRLLLVAGALLCCGAFIRAASRMVYLNGTSLQTLVSMTWVDDFVTNDVLGLPVALRFLVGVVALMSCVFCQRLASNSAHAAVAWCGGLGVVAAIMAIASYVFDGHSATVEPCLVMLVGSASHVVGGMVWGGGVFVVSVMAWSASRGVHGTQECLPVVLRSFARIAMAAVAVIAVSGAAMAWSVLPQLSSLWETTWGRALLVKVAVVVVALSLGAFHHRRISQTHAGAAPDIPVRTLFVEVGAIGLIVVASAILVDLSAN